jgi:hypothetical protein
MKSPIKNRQSTSNHQSKIMNQQRAFDAEHPRSGDVPVGLLECRLVGIAPSP